MSYYPSVEEIARLGFQLELDADSQPYFGQTKTSSVSGRTGSLELMNDEGHAVLVEWLGPASQSDVAGLHGWTTCTCYEELEHACNTAFDVIAEGR